jgi:hypothetical protein
MMVPGNSSNVIREQMLYQSVRNMNKIVKYIKNGIISIKATNNEVQEME